MPNPCFFFLELLSFISWKHSGCFRAEDLSLLVKYFPYYFKLRIHLKLYLYYAGETMKAFLKEQV